MRRRRRLNKKHVLITGMVAICIVAILTFIISKILYRPVYKSIEVEAGTKLTAQSFLKKGEEKKAVVKNKTDLSHTSKLGEHELTIIYNDKEYESRYNIVDTKKPTATIKKVEGYVDYKLTPKDFVSNIKDGTKVTVSFVNKIDFSTEGSQTVKIQLKDEAKNTTQLTTTLVLQEDDEAPEIKGVKEIVIPINSTVSYKKDITVTDNADKEPSLEVDHSQVNLSKKGNYEIIYTATDKVGNVSSKKTLVKVMNPKEMPVSQEELDAKIKPIIAKIITPGMGEREKARAIFRYVKSHVNYVDHSVKKYWQNGAMTALKTGSGDCFNFYSLSKALLTEAGIENIDLSANTRAHHYWNFVKIDNKWYHFDTTPRSDHPNLFLRTDAWMTRYSRSHALCFKWNQKKPASATS